MRDQFEKGERESMVTVWDINKVYGSTNIQSYQVPVRHLYSILVLPTQCVSDTAMYLEVAVKSYLIAEQYIYLPSYNIYVFVSLFTKECLC